MLCHFLTGIPASGKSTFAQLLAQTGDYQIISSDTIRQQLYGDENIQGNWLEIEAEMLKQMQEAIILNRGIIYDATNVKRAWRIDLLNKIAQQLNSKKVSFTKGDLGGSENIEWLAWYINLDLKVCKQQNQQRERKVPENIIDKMAENIKLFPPHVAEGFIHVQEINNQAHFNVNYIQQILGKLPRIIINRNNKTNHPNLLYHPYSRLVDFERLMHLISLLINYPALGNLQFEYPNLIQQIFGEEKTFPDSLAEITAIMAKLKGNIYGKSELIEQDLIFLENQDLIHSYQTDFTQPKITDIPTFQPFDIISHYASKVETFQRILTTLKVIINCPFSPKLEDDLFSRIPNIESFKNGYLVSLAYQLVSYENLELYEVKNRLEIFRKDLEFIFKPYQILPNIMRNGYFFGTGIFTEQELKQTFNLLQNQVKNIDDPLGTELFDKFGKRLKLSKIASDSSYYPVKAIANRSFIDPELLDAQTLTNKVPDLVEIIETGQLVELSKFANRPSFEGEKKGQFKAWLLQIVFYNFAWYLGFEQEDKLIKFERLDRLYLERKYEQKRGLKEQKKALNKLNKLLSASAGIFLGDSAKEQRQFLSKNLEERKQVETTVELWFNEEIFGFIAEATKRFPANQMKMSKPPKSSSLMTGNNKIFSLNKSKDKNKPYRFQVILPKWSLKEFDFCRWILGFGGNVKVHQPDELRHKIIELSTSTLKVYDDS